MITIPELVAQALGSFLSMEMRGRFGASHAALAEFLPYAAKLTLECIGNSDALYHNIEHSMLVTLVGNCSVQPLAGTTPVSFWPALRTTSATSVALFTAMRMHALSLI
jgi:hypothetical protein